MGEVLDRFRSRLLPALLTALGVALITNGILTYTSPVEAQPALRAFETFAPTATVPPLVDVLPEDLDAAPSFKSDRVATRIVVDTLNIDLPIMLQLEEHGTFPLCDVAMYLPSLSQPGQGGSSYIYAHARRGMFLPLLDQSRINDGAAMLGQIVDVYTSDDSVFHYQITEVRRHTTSLEDAINGTIERLWLQTSEGPIGTIPKLQVVADYLFNEKTTFEASHPAPHPRICQ
ncbi:MAG TPA: hypothetical protein VEX41_07970 [Candidatus Eisenbacteria bacterium]|nr:hypothetical protein [Candidatus Eisenbacteria bacterium]